MVHAILQLVILIVSIVVYQSCILASGETKIFSCISCHRMLETVSTGIQGFPITWQHFVSRVASLPTE